MASLLHCHQQTVQRLLSEAITVLCQNSLPFRDHLCVQGLLGITLDNRDVLLVDIHERVARSGGFDQWENQNHHPHSQDERHDHQVSDSRYATPPTGKMQDDGVVLNRNMYNHHVAARLQQQQQQQSSQDPPSIAFLSKMYERQMSAFKMDPYANNKQQQQPHSDSASPPRLTSSPRERASHDRPRDRSHERSHERSHDRSHDRPLHKMEAERERLANHLEPPTLEAEERGAEVERRPHDNAHNPHNSEGNPEGSEGTKQSEGHLMLNGHSSPPSFPDCQSPSNLHSKSQEATNHGSTDSELAVNLSSSHPADNGSHATISNSTDSTEPGSSSTQLPPKDGSTSSSSTTDSCLKNDATGNCNMNSDVDRDPADGTIGSSNVTSQNPAISPNRTPNIVDHRSPTPSGGEQQNQSAMSPSGEQQNRDSISLTVSKIFSHRFEGQPPLKKRLTEIAEQQNAEEREKERNPENEEDGEAVNYTVCHSVKGKLRGSQKRKARVSYPLDLSKVSQYDEEDREEEDLAEWGVNPDKDLSTEDLVHDIRPSTPQSNHVNHSRSSPHGSEGHPQRSPPHLSEGNVHQRAAAYDDHQQQQQQQQQRMMIKSNNNDDSHQVVNNNTSGSMSNQTPPHSQHNSVGYGSSMGPQRSPHLLPPHLPVNMFDGPPLGGSAGDMGLSLMINNLVNAYGPGLPLPGLGSKPPQLSPVSFHHSGKPPNLNLGNLGSMSLGSGSPQHSPHLLSPAHVGSPHSFNSNMSNYGNNNNNRDNHNPLSSPLSNPSNPLTPGTPTGMSMSAMCNNNDERGHKCSQCGKLVASLQGLMIHYRTHTGEKPHVCGMCGKGLSTVQGLQVHQRTHTGEKPYVCTTCGKGFNDKSNMKRHIRHCTLRAPTRFLLSNPLHHMSHS